VTQSQLLRSVAGRTGESIETLRYLGFQLHVAAPDFGPVGEGPRCRRPMPNPGLAGDGSPTSTGRVDPGCNIDLDPARDHAARP